MNRQIIKLPPGKRLTKSKQAIVDLLVEENGHISTEELFRVLKKKLPNLGLATVYRNLNDLANLGILNQLSYPGLPLYYEYAKDKHAHFYCEYCHNIYDVEMPIKSINTSKQWQGHYIKEINIEFKGICKKCILDCF